jgi:hypothetical protein
MDANDTTTEPRQSPLLTVAACVFVVLLALLFSCVNDLERTGRDGAESAEPLGSHPVSAVEGLGASAR